MYWRPEFERNLCHWSELKRFDDILTDIYDVADSNLGLMLNLDWFQPSAPNRSDQIRFYLNLI
ncbi:hypothetical protein RhiirA5_447393 [Rhizophagus irregularis]|uniref:Uncharacterized protein n=1 Tax=Rhizophagus irregularis TaxID=588596 RepID=A0A2N0NB70_9GLOM|nr:hypothetical protein RhiirA5_447393 [Rhizophagus irregularis]